MEETDVLVVGAGPTGLLLAAELARQGVKPRLVEKRAERSQESRALAVQARTLEVLEHLGVLEDLRPRSRLLQNIWAFARGRPLVRLSLRTLESPHPYALIVPQSETERVLEARAQSLGVKVERRVSLTGLSQDADGVMATLAGEGGTWQVRARWVVGCDGAHSGVRRALGLDFEGQRVGGTFTLADLRLEGLLVQDGVYAFLTPEGPLACIPLPEPGMWRLVAALPVPEGAAPEPPSLELYQRLLDTRAGMPLKASEPRWMTHFQVSQRESPAWRVGRVFLAGDAAHVHSPVGGQGMNTGLQDAWNLAWKLALVARGEGPPGLLDTYEAERHPVAARLLRVTGLGTRAIALHAPAAQRLRDAALRQLGKLGPLTGRLAKAISELDVSYRRGPLAVEHMAAPRPLSGAESPDAPDVAAWLQARAAPRAGDRAPDGPLRTSEGPAHLFRWLGGPKHLLLVFEGEVPTAEQRARYDKLIQKVRASHGERVTVYRVLWGAEPLETDLNGAAFSVFFDRDGALHERYGTRGDCLYLIRPDGYVGCHSMPAEEGPLNDYFQRVFR